MLKKIILGTTVLLITVAGVFFAINQKDNYDATKYTLTLSNGLNTGSTINLILPDQFNKTHKIDKNTKLLILSFTKATGHMVKGFLSKQPKGYLSSKNAFFIADISPMPTVIRNAFALPDLKKSNYCVLLIYDKKIASKIKNDKKADKVAIITLKNNIITNIKYISTQKELKNTLINLG